MRSKAAESRARQRALKADPFPKPRGRVPRGSSGLPQVWDKELGGWTDAVPQPAWAWSSSLELLELGAASAAVVPAAAEAVAATTTFAWEAPIFSQLEEREKHESENPGGRTQVHERVQVTPNGSRAHTIEEISPGGTVRQSSHTSPAGEQRCNWRARMRSHVAQARRDARGVVVLERYSIECMHCGREQHIMPDGCMFPHSLRETMSRSERAVYRESQAYAERAWQCPGSREYYGPCKESEGEEESEEGEE